VDDPTIVELDEVIFVAYRLVAKQAALGCELNLRVTGTVAARDAARSLITDRKRTPFA